MTTRQAVLTVLANDLACDVKDFERDGVIVVEAEERAGRRRFPFRRPSLWMVTTGRGVVISCNQERAAHVQRALEGIPRNHVFGANTLARLTRIVTPDGQELHGPYQNTVSWPTSFDAAQQPSGTDMELLYGSQVRELYRYPGFDNALGYHADDTQPDVVAVAARSNGQVVGVAGVSADSDVIWQIGVDVQAAYQQRGIGRAMVSRATEAVFKAGRVPHYGYAVANLPSARLVLSLGYWPAWIEVYARDVRPHRNEQPTS